MTTFFYNVGIHIYGFLIKLVSPFHAKAKQWVAGRKDFFKVHSSKINKKNRHVWFHAASLGEFEQARPLIEAFKKEYPQFKIVLTFFSPSGYEIRKNYTVADHVFYLPNDTKQNSRRFVELINPEMVFFAKYEFWHNYLNTLRRKKIPVYLFSAIFRSNQLFFKSYGQWYRNMLNCFTHIFVQNDNSKELLKSIDFKNVTVSGDTRFDRVYDIAQHTKKFDKVEEFKAENKLIIAGSTWPADESLLKEFVNNALYGIKFVFAPHEVHKSNIERLVSLFEKDVVKFSEKDDAKLKAAKVLVIDNIGILSSLYQYGDIAYIGGGFGVGIHNILEAATFGLPVLFGPNYKKFHEAVELAGEKGAFPVSNYKELKSVLDKLITDKEALQFSQEVCKNYVNRKRGATNTILTFLANSAF